MPKPLKLVVWVVVFAACAGVGAFVASRSNPFPPGVEDPGAHTTTPTQTPTEPAPTAWALTMRVNSQHTLHEGGACRSDWSVTGTIEIDLSGKASGAADAKLAAPAACDFQQAQVQAKAIGLVVKGERAGGVLKLSFSESSRTPVGSFDLGGFTNTIRLIRPVVTLPAGAQAGHASAKVTRSDGDLGSYSSTSLLRVALQ